MAKEAGLLINPRTTEKKQGQYFQTRKVTGEKKSTGKGGRSYHDRDPVVDPNKITDKEIHRRTSFKTLNDLLFFVVVATNGDLTLLSKTISPLTWFEEWMLFFELQSSKSIHRWIDAAASNGYDIHEKYVVRIFDTKLMQVLSAKKSWPRYLNFEEDHFFMKDEWKIRYLKHRINQWDMTGLGLRKPSDPALQLATYSLYYAMNCLKGGVSYQLGGWITNENLWSGAVSDTRYNTETKILAEQDEFSKKDLVENEEVPFTNVLDKGYRLVLAAWQTGNQLVLQPDYKKSDTKFSGQQVISSAIIAEDRSANERAVRLAKKCGYLNRGLQGNVNMKRMDNCWLAWGFQVNFMFERV